MTLPDWQREIKQASERLETLKITTFNEKGNILAQLDPGLNDFREWVYIIGEFL